MIKLTPVFLINYLENHSIEELCDYINQIISTQNQDSVAEKLIGDGYLALYEFNNNGCRFNNGFYEMDLPLIDWWIVKEDYWNEFHYIDDRHLGLDIPEFGEDMESCFTYQPLYPNGNLELQSKKLTELGFKVLPLE